MEIWIRQFCLLKLYTLAQINFSPTTCLGAIKNKIVRKFKRSDKKEKNWNEGNL